MSDATTGLALLRNLLTFDPSTGLFSWKVARRGIGIGDIAGGRPNSHGYMRVCVDGRLHYAHRLAWLFATGDWPAGVIDHINGDKADNRIANLRDVSIAHNQHNQRRAQRTAGRTSRFLGVSLIKASGKWKAAIKVSGKTKVIGHFANEEDAYAAYINTKQQVHGVPA